MASIAIRVRNVSKRYKIGQREGYQMLRDRMADAFLAPFRAFSNHHAPNSAREEAIWALDGVSFEIEAGEIVGIIGRNGAGKTTLLKILSRITAPTRGEFDLLGRVGALLEVGTGFHGELTGRENIYFNGAFLGMKRAEISRKFDDIVGFAEIEKFLDTPVKRYSTGMYMRLAFSVAAHLEPEILLVDEVLAVGDAAFQRKCLNKMEEVGRGGRTVLFVSHNVPSVLRLCQRVILLDGGAVAADGPPQTVMSRYLSSGSSSSAERLWPEVEMAPGDSVARIRAVRVLNEMGGIGEVVDVGDPVCIEMEYWALQWSERLTATLRFFNEEGVCLFASAPFGALRDREGMSGVNLIRARCRIPAHVFAEGRVFVLAAVITYGYPSTVHAIERDAVCFQVVDRRGTDGVREYYGGHWQGVVRPRLRWEIEHGT